MPDSTLFLPMAALAIWTLLVLLLIPFRRFKASFAGEVGPGDFRYGESERVSPWVSLPNRNYMNLLEAPMLFYALCIAVEASALGSSLFLSLAWTYVALRVIHSLIHLSYNNVIHRLIAFASSNLVLAIGWGLFAWRLLVVGS